MTMTMTMTMITIPAIETIVCPSEYQSNKINEFCIINSSNQSKQGYLIGYLNSSIEIQCNCRELN